MINKGTMMKLHTTTLVLACALAGCGKAPPPEPTNAAPAANGAAAAADREPDENMEKDPLLSEAKVAHSEVAEAFLTAATPQDNLDSPAAWAAPDGKRWVITTAKKSGELVVFDGDSGERLRTVGGEFGVNTGRPRRTGWYDAVMARHASRINGFTDYFVTKLDVLTGLEEIPVCVAYDVDGVRHDEMPVSQSDFHHAQPIYEELDGWWEDISECRSYDELPENARRYVEFVEEQIGARVSVIGVGPGRDEVIVRHDLLGSDDPR